MELKLNSAFTAVGKAEGKRIFTVRNREDVNKVIGYKCGQALSTSVTTASASVWWLLSHDKSMSHSTCFLGSLETGVLKLSWLPIWM